MLPEINPNQAITLDLETCDPELKYTAPGFISKVGFVAGIAVASKEGSWYIPINHSEGKNYNEKEVIDWLNYICGAKTTKIFHNAQYDLGWLKYIGVQVHGNIFDTMLAAPLLDENRFSYQLDSLGKIYCNEGKFEEALKTAVADKFSKVYTHKAIIRLKEEGSWSSYKPFIDAKARVSQFYELWPDEVKARYDVLGYQKSANGQELFKVPCRRGDDIKSLLWAIDPVAMGTYPIQDVDLTRKLAKKFMPMLMEEELGKVFKLESELIMPLMEMRENGVRIDMEKAVELDKVYSQTLIDLQSSLDEGAGFKVDVNKDSDLIQLCSHLGLEYALTDKGNPCFSSEKIPHDDQGLFDKVLDIRKYSKARDTYVRGYLFGCTIDGWLHGQYNQLKSDEGGTVTGRLSSSAPNMQNMPNPKKDQIGKDIRGCFLPDNDEERWLSMDYSGQEPKMLVDLVLRVSDMYKGFSGHCEKFPGETLARKEEFRGRKADFHTAVSRFCMIEEWKLEGKTPSGEEFEKAVKGFRDKAKSIGLGTMYGSGAKKIAEQMTMKGIPMTTEEAAAIRSSIYANVPFLKSATEYITAQAKNWGYIKTLLGRRGRFPKWEVPITDNRLREHIPFEDTLFNSKADAMKWINDIREGKVRGISREDRHYFDTPRRAFTYKALNKYIQGSSADQTKVAMVHLYKRDNLDLNALDIYYRRVPEFIPPKFKTQVHDEINISLREGEDVSWYQRVMESCLDLFVEAVADPVVCAKWSEAK